MSEIEPELTPKIIIKENGPYKVEGKVPLIKLTQVCSEFGEPLEWQFLGDQTPKGNSYLLCRCGKSNSYPFCDGTHKLGFDGTETARTDRASLRVFTYKGPELTVKKGLFPLHAVRFLRPARHVRIRACLWFNGPSQARSRDQNGARLPIEFAHLPSA